MNYNELYESKLNLKEDNSLDPFLTDSEIDEIEDFLKTLKWNLTVKFGQRDDIVFEDKNTINNRLSISKHSDVLNRISLNTEKMKPKTLIAMYNVKMRKPFEIVKGVYAQSLKESTIKEAGTAV